MGSNSFSTKSSDILSVPASGTAAQRTVTYSFEVTSHTFGPLTSIELRKVGGTTVITFGERRWPVSEALFVRFPERPPESRTGHDPV